MQCFYEYIQALKLRFRLPLTSYCVYGCKCNHARFPNNDLVTHIQLMDFGQGRKSFSKPLLLSYRLSLSAYLTGPIRVGQKIDLYEIMTWKILY